MPGNVEDFKEFLDRDSLAEKIASDWSQKYEDRRGWNDEKRELRNYIFATDTSTTTNSSLEWRNTTTLPKLCQIRDNLHANYMAALFPNDNWIKWEGYTEDAEVLEKKEAIESYVANKVRLSDFRNTISKLLYDYIDYGNAFGEVKYVNETRINPETEEVETIYSGPRLYRISPLDIVFNPLATSFNDSPKITRYLKTIGELKQDAQDKPELNYLETAINKIEDIRRNIANFDTSDFEKSEGYRVDGFGSLQEYYKSNYVELLEFEGDIYDSEHDTLLRNQIITIVDRTHILRQVEAPYWIGKSNKFHVGWRTRPDNIYAMGPLDNLVGMQYRIDHLENIKADLFDLVALPPVKIKGNVEPFEWGPLAEIYMGDDGEVDVLQVDTTALQADTQIAILEQKMEEFAGAPKQAMGVRTPGEKTAYEVQTLENAAGRIFQNKIVNFEINIVEPALNMYLESGRRNLSGSDLLRVMDDDIGVVQFMEITKDDITAEGKLRPIGARHFAAQAQLVQNLAGSMRVAAQVPGVMNHVSSKKLASLLFEEISGLGKFDLVSENIAIEEQAETQRLVNQTAEDLETEAATPVEEEDDFLA